MNKNDVVVLGNLKVEMRDSKLLIDISKASGKQVFELMAFLHSLKSSSDRSQTPVPAREAAPEQEEPEEPVQVSAEKSVEIPKERKRQTLSKNHPKIRKARRLLNDGSLTVKEICEKVGISGPSFYRYIKPRKRTTKEDSKTISVKPDGAVQVRKSEKSKRPSPKAASTQDLVDEVERARQNLMGGTKKGS